MSVKILLYISIIFIRIMIVFIILSIIRDCIGIYKCFKEFKEETKQNKTKIKEENKNNEDKIINKIKKNP